MTSPTDQFFSFKHRYKKVFEFQTSLPENFELLIIATKYSMLSLNNKL